MCRCNEHPLRVLPEKRPSFTDPSREIGIFRASYFAKRSPWNGGRVLINYARGEGARNNKAQVGSWPWCILSSLSKF